jgi:hypothetical protein
MYNGTLRKLKAKNCFIGDCDGDDTSAPTTPFSEKGGRKRKDAEDGDGTPATSGRTRGAKKSKAKEVEDDEDLLDEPSVKAEDEEENADEI